MLVVCDGVEMILDQQFCVICGDCLIWLVPIQMKEYLVDLCQVVTLSIKCFFGDFIVRGDVLVGDLFIVYGVVSADVCIVSLIVVTLF